MSAAWHWFVIAATLLSMVFFLWLLFKNRSTDGGKTGHEWDGIEEFDNPLPAWWVWMFVVSMVFAAGYLAFYPGLGNFTGVGSWTSQNEHAAAVDQHAARFGTLYAKFAAADPAEIITNPDAMQVGRRLFINNCAICHGVNAGGAPGFPSLRDEHWIWGGSFTDIQTSITNGRIAAMPPWGPALGDSGVTNVAHYVRALADLEHDDKAAERGAGQFQIFCVSCHGAEGKGNPALGAPDLTAGAWVYGADLTSIASSISLGRNGVMPAFGPVLDADRIKILSAYIQSLRQ